MAEKDKKIKFKDFETALARLEEITRKLEAGETKLDETLALYSEGIKIAEFCQRTLADTEKKIIVLKEAGLKLTGNSDRPEGEMDNAD